MDTVGTGGGPQRVDATTVVASGTTVSLVIPEVSGLRLFCKPRSFSKTLLSISASV